GTEHYARQLIKALIEHNERLSNPHQLLLYFREAPDKALFPKSDHVQQIVIPMRRVWTHIRFASAIWQTRPEITFVPAHTLPFFFPGKAAVTIHDLGYKYFPQAHTRKQRLYLDLTTAYSARRAHVVFADSIATAKDLQQHYGISREKIHVVYPGVEPPTISDFGAVKKRYKLPERYFLFIGTLQPRKNIQRLVQAYRLWQQSNPSEDIGLVLAGGKGWLYDEQWIEGVTNVHLIGYVDEVDKGALYQNAVALVFPSLYEGFGFPAVEAMHCGTPVLASNTSSLPELVGEAGLLVNPLDTQAIAEGMARLASDKSLRQTLQQQGYEQARQFTWEQAAQAVFQAFEQA
ncbi:MAG: glycosyltransferase family 1 protein, partial [Chloroflexi bacterium]